MAEKKDGRDHPKDRAGLLRAFEKMGNTIEKVEPVRFHPTGILSLDMAFHGGLPIGRMVLWYGFTGTGKSTTAYLIIRNYTRMGDRCLLIDTERSFDETYANRIGIDLSLVDVLKPDTLEQMWDMMIMALDSKAYSLIVLDTLAKLSPSTELVASVSKEHMGLGPRINSKSTRMWARSLELSGSTVLILNQERTNLSTYGAPNTNPGGKAVEHDAAVALYMTTRGKTEHDGQIIFRYQIRRTKVFQQPPPYDNFELHLIEDDEHLDVDSSYELFFAARNLGIFEDADGGPWVNRVAFFEGEKIANGEANIIKFFDEPSDIRTRIEARVIEEISNGSTARGRQRPPSADGGERGISDEPERGLGGDGVFSGEDITD